MLPILEYSCLKVFCKPTQSSFIGLNDLYLNLASPLKSNRIFGCVSFQLFVLSKWASGSSSGLPEYSGIKWDQCNGGICSVGWCGASVAWETFGIIGLFGFWGVGDFV